MMSLFSNNVAVSLVDDSAFLATQDRPSPLVFPAYVAFQTGTTMVLAVGEEARRMSGREPGNIRVVRAIEEGVVVDREAGAALFRFALQNLGSRTFVRPRVVVAMRNHEAGKLTAKDVGRGCRSTRGVSHRDGHGHGHRHGVGGA